MKRFRSLKAFGKYAKKTTDKLSPVRVMMLLHREEQGLRRSQIVKELKANPDRVDDAVFELVKDGAVTIEQQGEDPGDYQVLVKP